MLKVTSITGNVFHDKELNENHLSNYRAGVYEVLRISRDELEKPRFRKKTNKGSDIGLILERGSRLHHGDVLKIQDKFIIVEQIPEKVISINIKKSESYDLKELLVLIGHMIGNRHRPISIGKNGEISFPIHADSEVEVFRGLFGDIIDYIDLNVEMKMFHPHNGMNVHEH